MEMSHAVGDTACGVMSLEAILTLNLAVKVNQCIRQYMYFVGSGQVCQLLPVNTAANSSASIACQLVNLKLAGTTEAGAPHTFSHCCSAMA